MIIHASLKCFPAEIVQNHDRFRICDKISLSPTKHHSTHLHVARVTEKSTISWNWQKTCQICMTSVTKRINHIFLGRKNVKCNMAMFQFAIFKCSVLMKFLMMVFQRASITTQFAVGTGNDFLMKLNGLIKIQKPITTKSSCFTLHFIWWHAKCNLKIMNIGVHFRKYKILKFIYLPVGYHN